MSLTFSILIPVYNQVGKMDRCMDAIRNQTFGDFEVICVDDGSTDDSYSMLMEYSRKDPRVRVVRLPLNSSLVGARYAGMQEAKGEYVLFVDSDDSIDTNTLQILKERLQENPVDVLRFGIDFTGFHKVSRPVKTDDPLRAYLEGKEIPSIVRRVYSAGVIKEAVLKIRPFYCNMGEDTFFSGVFLSLAKSFGAIDDVLYRYETGGMSSAVQAVSVKKLDRDLESAKQSGEHLLAFMEQYNPEYLPPARKAVRSISRYIAAMAVLSDNDLLRVVETLKYILDNWGEELYAFTCRRILEYKVRKMLTDNEYTMGIEKFLEMLREDI